MTRFASLAALAIAAASLSTALPAAAETDGSLQVKLLGTAVLPDGAISDVELDTLNLPAGTQTRADDNYVPTLAIEYFVSPNISLETICCVTQHDVVGTGPLAGAGLVSNANIVPATLTAKYHLFPEGAVRPYVGVGPTYFIFIDEGPGGTISTLGATRQTLSDSFGVAVQAGVDIPVNDSGLALSIDAKRYWVSTTARWFNASGNQILRTRHTIDPWVISAGIAYRF